MLRTSDSSREAWNDASCTPAHDASRVAGARLCAWCKQPLPVGLRRDALCCSVRCRQARHRFTKAVRRAPAVACGRPLRLAYADPPYPGNARLYRGHVDYAGEVDHVALLRRLADYDGWALSTSATALPAVLALCPPDVRIAAWHRGERPSASGEPLSAWEPVIYRSARPLALDYRRADSLVHGVSPMTTLPGRVIGAKPATFCRWVFDLLGAVPTDTFDDLFPGSGAVTQAWSAFIAADTSRTPADDASSQAPSDGSRPSVASGRARQLGLAWPA